MITRLSIPMSWRQLVLCAATVASVGCTVAPYPDGSEGGACYGNGSCDDGLTCASEVCVQLPDGGEGEEEEGEGEGEGEEGEGNCTSTEMITSGVLHTSIEDVDYSGRNPTILAKHKLDIDEVEDGCFSGLDATFDLGVGHCEITVSFDSVVGGFGGIVGIQFNADSFCPAFPDDTEGLFVSQPGYFPFMYAGIQNINDRSAEASCLPLSEISFPDQEIRLTNTAASTSIMVNLGNLEATGVLRSVGDPSGICFLTPACGATFHDGGDGWCVSQGCSVGYYDGGDGVCRATGCASGYHDGGDGQCVLVSTCSAGFHDGGNQICLATGAGNGILGCSPGFVDNNGGAIGGLCTDNEATTNCALGFTDSNGPDALGVCVPNAATAPCDVGFIDSNGASAGGACVDDSQDECIADFSDTNGPALGGTCVQNTSGQIACLADFTDSNGTARGGRCVSNNRTTDCLPGFIDSNGPEGGGTCIAGTSDSCAPGFSDTNGSSNGGSCAVNTLGEVNCLSSFTDTNGPIAGGVCTSNESAANCAAEFTDSNGAFAEGTCISNSSLANCDGGFTDTNGLEPRGTCTSNAATAECDEGFTDTNGSANGGTCSSATNGAVICDVNFTDSNGSIVAGVCVPNLTAALCDDGFTDSNGSAAAGTCVSNRSLAACDVGFTDGNGSNSGGTCIPVAVQIVPADATAFTGTSGSVLAEALVVTVTDADGLPFEGFVVSFVVTSGGGSLLPVGNGLRLTDSEGHAAANLILGPTAGTNTVEVRAAGLAGSPVVFAVTGEPGPAAQIAVASGDKQSGLAGSSLSAPLVVVVRDAHGNPVPNASVGFAMAIGDGRVEPTQATTNGLGVAETTLILGATVGANVVEARLVGLAVPPVQFTAASRDFDFGAGTVFTAPTGPRSIAVADFDRDGKSDLATANSSGNFSVFKNGTAAGSLTPVLTRVDFPSSRSPTMLAVSDFNRDNKLDIVAANIDSIQPPRASVFTNFSTNGSVVFSQVESLATTVGPPGVVAAGDMNGDGKPDLVVANTGSGTVSIFRNDTVDAAQGATFAARADFATTSLFSVALADINGDGKLDILTANFLSDFSVLLNTTPSGSAAFTFASRVGLGAPTNIGSGGDIDVGDLNGDGKLDVVVTQGLSPAILIYLNTTPPLAAVPTFSSPLSLPAFDAVGNSVIVKPVVLADINGDSKLDIVTASFFSAEANSGVARIFRNTTVIGAAAATFLSASDFTLNGIGPNGIAATDLNADGRLDLAFTRVARNFSSPDVVIMLSR